MFANITRRDFVNGMALTAGMAMLPLGCRTRPGPEEAQNAASYYPPALTGMRGSHPGSFDAAHSLRDGDFWKKAGKPRDTGEVYDLVVVGGGISGLAAAHYYRKAAGENARILILDNHDDFGGHAKRNEFRIGDRTLLGFGGTFSIESPEPYSAVSKVLVEELGIEMSSYPQRVNKSLYRSLGMRPKVFFDKETFGTDKLITNPMPFEGESEEDFRDWGLLPKFAAESPFSETAKRDFLRLWATKQDYFPGLTSDQKKLKLAKMPYAQYLTEKVGVAPEIVKFYQASLHSLFGVGIEAVAAQDAWGLGFPGFAGLHLQPGNGKGMSRDATFADAEKYFFHFPDGNASIARLLVRKLIPSAIPGKDATDVVTARANYARLDEVSSAVRIRLNSTAVRVKHLGDVATAQEVEITYANKSDLATVRAKHCILACWHVVIPYICEELPPKQQAALASAQKVPLLYTNVVINNWTAFQKLGVSSVYAPGSYHSSMNLDLLVSIGDYHCPGKPEEPIVVHMMKAACKPGLPAREQHQMGRTELYLTTFEEYERNIRQQLGRTLGAGGFDPARDIAAITVNRWPHGYSYEYNSLFDDFWIEGGETPCEVARKPHGRIAIANADAGAYAYTDGAIDQAWRAVGELTKG